MNYFKQLLKALQDIAGAIIMNNKKQNEILERLADKYESLFSTTSGCITVSSMDWQNVISSNLVEDSRDTGVMIDRKKAVKIVTINGKAEKTETYTRETKLTQKEIQHHNKYGIVLIVE
jgi:hypothetical protein